MEFDYTGNHSCFVMLLRILVTDHTCHDNSPLVHFSCVSGVLLPLYASGFPAPEQYLP